MLEESPKYNMVFFSDAKTIFSASPEDISRKGAELAFLQLQVVLVKK